MARNLGQFWDRQRHAPRGLNLQNYADEATIRF